MDLRREWWSAGVLECWGEPGLNRRDAKDAEEDWAAAECWSGGVLEWWAAGLKRRDATRCARATARREDAEGAGASSKIGMRMHSPRSMSQRTRSSQYWKRE